MVQVISEECIVWFLKLGIVVKYKVVVLKKADTNGKA